MNEPRNCFSRRETFGGKTAKTYAQKLHKLRQVPILIQYHTEEILLVRKIPITVLISEYVEGDLLSEFLKKFPGQRLHPYQALHLLYALTCGIEEIHLLNETHGDLHTDNIIVNRFGLEFEVKLLDLFNGPIPKKETRQQDICELIRIFYDVLGGAKQILQNARHGEGNLLRAQAVADSEPLSDHLPFERTPGKPGLVIGYLLMGAPAPLSCGLSAKKSPQL